MENINCKHCGRFLFERAGSVVIEKVTCPNCKAKSNYKIIEADQSKDLRHKFVNPEVAPKKKIAEVS